MQLLERVLQAGGGSFGSIAAVPAIPAQNIGDSDMPGVFHLLHQRSHHTDEFTRIAPDGGKVAEAVRLVTVQVFINPCVDFFGRKAVFPCIHGPFILKNGAECCEITLRKLAEVEACGLEEDR